MDTAIIILVIATIIALILLTIIVIVLIQYRKDLSKYNEITKICLKSIVEMGVIQYSYNNTSNENMLKTVNSISPLIIFIPNPELEYLNESLKKEVRKIEDQLQKNDIFFIN